jgi:hypothetical protein
MPGVERMAKKDIEDLVLASSRSLLSAAAGKLVPRFAVSRVLIEPIE